MRLVPGRSDIDLYQKATGLITLYFLMTSWSDESKKWIIVAFAITALYGWDSLSKRATPMDYTTNLNWNGLMWVLAGVVGLFTVSMTFSSISFDILNVNNPLLTLPEITQPLLPLSAAISVPMNKFLWQFFIVANAEEVMKFSFQCGLYDWLDDRYGVQTAAYVGFGVVIITWASMHAILAYTSGNIIGHILAAVGAGVVLTLVIWKSGSLLGGVLAHTLYNWALTFM